MLKQKSCNTLHITEGKDPWMNDYSNTDDSKRFKPELHNPLPYGY